jgi:hypothetical protein
MRYTAKDLKENIQTVNEILLKSGSTYHYKYENRNGYHAVDLYNNQKCIKNLDCAEPPRKLSERLDDEYPEYLGKVSHL